MRVNADKQRHWVWTIASGATVGALMGIMCLLMAGLSFGVGLLVVVALLGGVLGGGWVWYVPNGSRWGHRLLMACVLCHVWLITLQALPAPGGGMNRRDWASPTVQGEFKAWTERINRLGFDLEQRDLEESLWTVAKGVMRTRKEALYPFHRYYRNAGTWQSWRMFVAPHRYPSRLHIDIKQDGEWNPVYVARSPTLNWKAEQLNHDRFRAALFRYGWGQKYPIQWKGFTRWIAAEAAHGFPEATHVRLRFWSYKTQTPEEVRDGRPEQGRWHRVVIVPVERVP